MDLSVEPEGGEVSLFGKTADDLQSGITISGNEISGTLKYVTGYTGFSSVPAEQSGNYLALKFDSEPEDAEITVELLGGTKGPVTLDEDRIHVLRIANKDSQSIRVIAKSGDDTITETYGLSGLIMETPDSE